LHSLGEEQVEHARRAFVKLQTLAAAVVSWSYRRGWRVSLAGLLLGVAALVYVAGHFAISTDTESLISQDVTWRREASRFDRAFPGKSDEIVVVVDGRTAELAEAAAAAITADLQARPDLVRAVSRPGAGAFFDQEGLLYLPRGEVQAKLDALLRAQPLLGPLAADPSLRGALGSLTTALDQASGAPDKLAGLERPLQATGDVVQAALSGRPAWFPWSELVQAKSDPDALRQIVLVEPKLDYAELAPGARATQAIRDAARRLGFTRARGVNVRVTGSVPLDDEQLQSLADGVPAIAAAMLLGVCGLLWLAVRSPKTILAILVTVAVGLAATAAFGLLLYGRFNLISVAFVALFVGLGVDFAIQFAVAFRAEQALAALVYRPAPLADRLGPADAPAVREPLSLENAKAAGAAGAHTGRALMIAAAATSLGFYAFWPTAYVGFSELGVIAGTGMILAFVLSLTLLPALLSLLRPGGGAAEAGFARLGPVGMALVGRRRAILWTGAAVAVGCCLLLPALRFDFDPVSLDSPRTESVSTLRDLARNPETTLNTLDVLARTPEGGRRLAARLASLPEVAHAVTLTSFVPDDQAAKLAMISDADGLLDPSLNPFDTSPSPTPAETMQSLATARDVLLKASASGGPASAQARRLADLLARLRQAPQAARDRVETAVTATLPTLLRQARAALTAHQVTLESLPPDLVRDWRAADGRVRIQVFPKGDTNRPAALDRFVAAVQTIAPDAVGAPIAVRGSQDTILQAFAAAMTLSTVAILALLFVVLRRTRDVALTLAPVALAALLTFASCAVFRIPINFENIVAVPLLVSVGTAFTIYFTLAWRRGATNLLDTSVARAVVFSAATTGLAFGSLCLSPHPGTSTLGALLVLSLGWTLACTLLLQPALLGLPRMRQS
jgi:uncharacterized protein